MANYTDQYKDPRWQKKRLEILDRDKYTCQSCGDGSSQLHVHHLYYHNTNKVWDYENDNFITLCDLCHEQVTEYIRDMISIVRGFGFSVDVANEAKEVIYQLDGLNPSELLKISRIIKVMEKGKY